MPKISVIVPVYKAEKYLHRCIDSILDQTFTDFELLLIDDGSTDNSGKICDEYALKDKRVRVFHKENGGVSSARNVGLYEAKGEYSVHIDADDWAERRMFEVLYKKAVTTNADMVICDYYINENGQQFYIQQQPQSLNPLYIQRKLFKELHGSCWNKLVRLSCYKIHKIHFNPNVRCKEDLLSNILLMDYIENIQYVNQAFYHYERNGDSITRSSKNRIINLQNDMYIIEALSKSKHVDNIIEQINSMKIRVKADMILSRRYSLKNIVQTYSECNSIQNIRLSNNRALLKLLLLFVIPPYSAYMKMREKI